MQRSLQELSELTDTQLIGDPTYLISGIEDLESATASDASFLANPRYRALL
jgi:UDP-3-O-[3-hydroxymyristoyl] glucosamine N-acyltransferase